MLDVAPSGAVKKERAAFIIEVELSTRPQASSSTRQNTGLLSNAFMKRLMTPATCGATGKACGI